MNRFLPCALTFDDGPNVNSTSLILSILKKNDVKATFFCVGSRALKHKEMIAEIVDQGHEIGNHSWSHQDFSKLSERELFQELNKSHSILSDLVGKEVNLLRPPFGIISAHQRALALEWFGYDTVLWNVDTGDWKNPGTQLIKTLISRSIGQGHVVLLHDTYLSTAEAVETTLDSLNDAKRHFTTVSRLRDLYRSTEASSNRI